MKKTILTVIFLIVNYLANPLCSQNILDKQKVLNKFAFWSNQDWDWYKKNIPFLDTPDFEIDQTYYYRWELLTIHLVYGSPESGYGSTEFINRPWWSGAYGTLSCPAGHQLYDYRWLRDQKFVKDYSKMWFKDPGTQPLNYTNWIGDAIWQGYKVNKDSGFIISLLEDLKKDYYSWEKKYWVEKEGMFAWDGMHDGMETNINSRQTPQWFEGAPGYRPTLNAYMWAEANSIVNIAKLVNNQETINEFQEKANIIKSNFQSKNWDASRNFFFHRFKNDEITANKKDTIKANTLTYQDGIYKGNPHGRELMAYVPWYFNMIDDTKEFGSAWKFLMDPEYFYADFGPTVVERHDPLFLISERCCVWSGNSWPFATSQTLKAMSNVLNEYKNINEVSKEDYFKMFKNFALTHRKERKPYIAEALHPDTGSFSGHDVVGHSEHYYHSSYIDLVISDLIGLKAQADDSIIVKPLTPKEWDYFLLEGVQYHGHTISIIWDKTGEKYNKGQGFQIISDGKKIASSRTVSELKAHLPYLDIKDKEPKLVNYAVNNSVHYFPNAIASFPGISHPISKMNDGQYWYLTPTTNQWSNIHSEEKQDWAGIDFGIERNIQKVIIYFVEDADKLKAPKSYILEYWNGNNWKEIPKQKKQYKDPQARKGNAITFPNIATRKIRVSLIPNKNYNMGISEIEAWGEAKFPISIPENNESKNPLGLKASASFTSQFDDINTIVDGKADKNGRWTAYESPNESDWVQIDFNNKTAINTAYIYFYEDASNIFPPKQVTIQFWNGSSWENVKSQKSVPENTLGNALNIVKFDEIKTDKIRVLMLHKPKKFSGIYEVEFYKFNR